MDPSDAPGTSPSPPPSPLGPEPPAPSLPRLSPPLTPAVSAPLELDAIRVSPDAEVSSIMSPVAGTAGRRGSVLERDEVRSIVAPRHYRDLALLGRTIAAHAAQPSRLTRLAAIEDSLRASHAAPAVVERLQELERAHRAIRTAGAPLRRRASAPGAGDAPPGGWVSIEHLEHVARTSTKPPVELIFELMTAAARVRPDDLPAGELRSLGDRRRDAVENALTRVGGVVADRALADLRGGMAEFIIDATRLYDVASQTTSKWARCARLFCRRPPEAPHMQS